MVYSVCSVPFGGSSWLVLSDEIKAQEAQGPDHRPCAYKSCCLPHLIRLGWDLELLSISGQAGGEGRRAGDCRQCGCRVGSGPSLWLLLNSQQKFRPQGGMAGRARAGASSRLVKCSAQYNSSATHPGRHPSVFC